MKRSQIRAKMDDTKDFLKEDGYLAVNDCTNIQKIIFHPNLNVILIFTNTSILSLDVNSGVVLQRVASSGLQLFISIRILTTHRSCSPVHFPYKKLVTLLENFSNHF